MSGLKLLLFSLCFTASVVFAADVASSLAMKPTADKVPRELDGVGITDKSGAKIDMGLAFKDETGKLVHLQDYFTGRKPVLLSLVYFGCPNLCTFYLNGLIDGMKTSKWNPGAEYEMVMVSIDDREKPVDALEKKAILLEKFGRPETAAGWHVLTGTKENIAALASTVGFGFKWEKETQQFAHAAAAMVMTPDGELARYLYGITFDEKTFRFSLLEASRGKIGGLMEKALLFCYKFDPHTKKYSFYAMSLMRIVAALTALILGFFVFRFFRRQRNEQRNELLKLKQQGAG